MPTSRPEASITGSRPMSCLRSRLARLGHLGLRTDGDDRPAHQLGRGAAAGLEACPPPASAGQQQPLEGIGRLLMLQQQIGSDTTPSTRRSASTTGTALTCRVASRRTSSLEGMDGRAAWW
jgi:hypothetical protein